MDRLDGSGARGEVAREALERLNDSTISRAGPKPPRRRGAALGARGVFGEAVAAGLAEGAEGVLDLGEAGGVLVALEEAEGEEHGGDEHEKGGRPSEGGDGNGGEGAALERQGFEAVPVGVAGVGGLAVGEEGEDAALLGGVFAEVLGAVSRA